MIRRPMSYIPYDDGFDPPAPVVPLRVRLPGPDGWLQLMGLVDTGADITLIPQDIAERHLPLAGVVGLRGVTGDVQQAAVYRAETEIGGVARVTLVAGFGNETIVGSDVLNRLVLSLDGPARQLILGSSF